MSDLFASTTNKMTSEEAPSEETVEPTGETETHESVLRRSWTRVTYALDWLRHPDQVGQPITLQPRGLRLLILLILGNLIVLILLTAGLFQATQTSSSIQQPMLVIPTAVPSTPTSTSTPGPTPTPFGSGGAIAFTLRRNGNADIYALNQADRQLIRLTNDLAEDREPTWSPDGNYVAFASNRAHNWDIYLLDLLSGALIRLTHDPDFDANPTWSPDGQWIAFESYRRGNLDVYVMSTSGQHVQRITADPAPNYEPAWSPDSQALAYTTFISGTKDIFVQPIDTPKEATNVTQSPDLDEYAPAWSPDGTQLAYVSGPIGNPSVQVTTFDWQTMEIDQAQTEIFGAGTSPAWAPDGQNLIYAYERSERSNIVAANLTGWALFHEVYNLSEPLDDLVWTSLPLSPRVIAQAQRNTSPQNTSFYLELLQPTPTAGPPYRLIPLPNVTIESDAKYFGEETEVEEERSEEESEEESEDEIETDQEAEETDQTPEPTEETQPVRRDDIGPFLSDRVNESFNALRQRVIEETGWDYLAHLSRVQISMNHTPPSGHPRKSWHVCGRAFALDQEAYEAGYQRIELVREDVGNATYWRVFIRAAEQDGSMGEPLREGVWNLNARQEGGRAMVEGGALKERIPPGYYVDFTALASDYGWERVPALWRWRYFWPDIRWWEYLNTDNITWWQCMLDVFPPQEIEGAFGPIPPAYRPNLSTQGKEKE